MVSDVQAKRIAELVSVCQTAGARTLEIRAEGDIGIDIKSDLSPVTRADQAADKIISQALTDLYPDIHLISEETADSDYISTFLNKDDLPSYWLVDPLDGTKEFIRGSDEFTVNIGLIVDRKPIFGIVYLPATGETYFGGQAIGAWYQKMDGQKRPMHPATTLSAAGWRVVASKSHATPQALTNFLAGQTVAETISVGSSLKFCLVVEGQADIYPRFGPTKEWDTAAGDAILRAAGGRMCFLDGQTFTYGKADLLNPGFVADNGLCQWCRESQSQ